MQKISLMLALFCVVATAAAQNSRWAVEIGAFADRVPLSYFKKLDRKVYETVDVNQIYRYYVDVADENQAAAVRAEAKNAGCLHARIIDFDYLREVCAKECSYTPPTKLRPLPEKKTTKTSIYDDSNTNKQNPANPPNNGNDSFPKDGIAHYAPPQNHYNFDWSNASSANYETLQKEDSLQRVEWIFFDFDRAHLREKSHEELHKVAYLLKKYPSYTVELHAHTDGKGSIAYNEKLSARRAASAQKYLRQLGIPKNRISTERFGKTKPIAANETAAGDTPTGRQFNRRVEIRILDAKNNVVDVVDIIQIPSDLRP